MLPTTKTFLNTVPDVKHQVEPTDSEAKGPDYN